MNAMLASSCSFFGSSFEAACEDVIKERLLAPSAYKRVSVDRSDHRMTRDEYVAYLQTSDDPEVVKKANLKSFDEGNYKPTTLRAYIKYDAPNAYGTPIRGTSVCEYFSDSGNESHDRGFYRLVVEVDGDSQTDWLVKRVKASQ